MLNHPNLVTFYGVHLKRHGLVLEWVRGGDLQNTIELKTRVILSQDIFDPNMKQVVISCKGETLVAKDVVMGYPSSGSEVASLPSATQPSSTSSSSAFSKPNSQPEPYSSTLSGSVSPRGGYSHQHGAASIQSAVVQVSNLWIPITGEQVQAVLWPQPDAHICWLLRLEIAYDVACALRYMHFNFSRPIAHRDVRSPNKRGNSDESWLQSCAGQAG